MISPSPLTHLATEIGTPRPRAATLMRLPRRRRASAAADDIAIRLAGNHDGTLLRKLEELDGRPLPTGRRLVAELGGVPVAAIAVADDTVVADPFAHTSAVVDLLRVRARQLRLAS